jgi:hypothetical protein
VTDPFPRGLPDGDPRKPMATAQWAASADAFRLLGEWKPGRFLIGRDTSGRYVGLDVDRHVLTVAGSRAGKGVSLIVPAHLLERLESMQSCGVHYAAKATASLPFVGRKPG